METFFMLGKYNSESMKDISSNRTEKTIRLIDELGGEVLSMYALLGIYDVVLKVKLPDMSTAMKASCAISLLTGIGFTTLPAVPVDDFDSIMGGQ